MKKFLIRLSAFALFDLVSYVARHSPWSNFTRCNGGAPLVVASWVSRSIPSSSATRLAVVDQ